MVAVKETLTPTLFPRGPEGRGSLVVGVGEFGFASCDKV